MLVPLSRLPALVARHCDSRRLSAAFDAPGWPRAAAIRMCPASVHQPSRIIEAHRAFADVGVVDVGDLQFAARRGHQRAHLVEHRRVVHVNAGHGVVRFRLCRLLFDARRSGRLRSPPRRSAPRPALPSAESARRAPAARNPRTRLLDRAFNDVVAQHHADLLPSAKCSASASASAMPPSPSW